VGELIARSPHRQEKSSLTPFSSIDGIRPMIPTRHPGRELDDAKHRAIIQRCTNLTERLVCVAGVIDWKRFRGPDHTTGRSRAARDEIFSDFVNLDDRASVGIMSRDYPS
jgi:hypothetical protein